MANEATLTGEAQPTEGAKPAALFAALRRNVTPKVGAALTIWRIEARLATPLALLMIATLGRWPGAFAMGGIMAAFSVVFLFLLDGERAMDSLRDWLGRRRWFRRYALPIAESRGREGAIKKGLAIPAVVWFMGPFFRAVTFHLFHMPRVPAYVISAGGSIPHSLFWTGLVLGSFYEIVIRPLFESIF